MLRSSESGQSLLEIVIGIGIFLIIIVAAATALVNEFDVVQTGSSSLSATLRAQEGLEAARSIRDRNWAELTAGAHGLALVSDAWTFSGGSDTAFDNTRTVTVTDVDASTKDVASTITWATTPSRPRTVTYTTRLKNWRAIGAPQLSGNWANPQTLGSVDLGPGTQANSIAVSNNIVYLAASAASAAKSDFYTVDATNGASPSVLGSINTSPEGLNEIAISGNYAYVANKDTTNQLQIINSSIPASPTLISSFIPPGLGDGTEGLSVAAVGTTVYLGLENNSGSEFFIIDASNPVVPIVVGSYNAEVSIYEIVIDGTTAYLGTDGDDRELLILDISNPATPLLRGRFDASGSSEDARGLDVHFSEGKTYLVRTVGSNNVSNHELIVVNTTDQANPTALGSLDIPHTINAIKVVDSLAFLATDDSNNEFKIYLIDNPANMTPYSSFNFSQVATDIAFENNRVYVSVRSNDALRIITSQ
ncbi:MAG: hypothetical protein Q7S89_03680 [bacterium]|nr:hypothetical protein [bacterium]